MAVNLGSPDSNIVRGIGIYLVVGIGSFEADEYLAHFRLDERYLDFGVRILSWIFMYQQVCHSGKIILCLVHGC